MQKLSDSDRKLRPNELILFTQNRNNGIESINAKAECDYTQDGKKTSFNITLKSKTDTAIWISISPALGIEVARAMLTPDSLVFLNKLEKTYFVSTYQELSEKLGSELNFYDLQDLLMYRIIKHQKKDKYVSSENDQHYELLKSIRRKVKRNLGLQGQNRKELNLDNINTTIELDSTKRGEQRMIEKEEQILIRTIIDKRSLAIISQSVKDVESNQELNINYGTEYFTDSTFVYPQKVDISVENKGQLYSTFSLSFSRFRINEEVKFSIRVPSKYDEVSP